MLKSSKKFEAVGILAVRSETCGFQFPISPKRLGLDSSRLDVEMKIHDLAGETLSLIEP